MGTIAVHLVENLDSPEPPVHFDGPRPVGHTTLAVLAVLFAAVSIALLVATVAFVQHGREPMWIRTGAAIAAAGIIVGLWAMWGAGIRDGYALRRAERIWPESRLRSIADTGVVTACQPITAEGQVTGFRLTIDTGTAQLRVRVGVSETDRTPRTGAPARIWRAGARDPVVIEALAD